MRAALALALLVGAFIGAATTLALVELWLRGSRERERTHFDESTAAREFARDEYRRRAERARRQAEVN